MTPESLLRLVRFGLFELDLKTAELRESVASRIALQEQPFQVLAMLVAHPGDLVTREELRAALGPDAVFVDFDHGLSKAVGKIRRALGDLAVQPAIRRDTRTARLPIHRSRRASRRRVRANDAVRLDGGVVTPGPPAVGRPRNPAGSGHALRRTGSIVGRLDRLGGRVETARPARR